MSRITLVLCLFVCACDAPRRAEAPPAGVEIPNFLPGGPPIVIDQSIGQIQRALDANGLPCYCDEYGRFYCGGTSLDAGDFVLSPGWGAQATIAVQAPSYPRSTDSSGVVAVIADGATGTHPSVTMTFRDGPFDGVPSCAVQLTGSNDTAVHGGMVAFGAEAGLLLWVLQGRPVSGKVYIFRWHCPIAQP